MPVFGMASEAAALLTIDFYIPALLFLVIWSGLLLLVFVGRMRSGLGVRIRRLADQLAEGRLTEGLFPRLEELCRRIRREYETLRELTERAEYFRRRLSEGGGGTGGRWR